MTDLIIQGINGRMGHTLVEKISARSDCRIVAGVDQKAGQIGDIPVYASLAVILVLIRSRLVSVSSRDIEPMISRSVVAERFSMAWMGRLTP